MTTDPETNYEYPTGMQVAGPTICILLLVLGFLALVLFLLLHGEHRRQLSVQLAASIMVAHLIIALFIHPASIQIEMMRKSITYVYCWVFVYLRSTVILLIPYTLIMFTVERLMYIKNPTEHAQKITRAGHITLVVFPWVFCSLYTVIELGAMSHDISYSEANSTTPECYHIPRSRSAQMIYIGRAFVGGIIPMLMSLAVTITVLVMWCCYKYKHSMGRDYSMMGEAVEVNVRNSVIAVAVLNGLFMPMFFAEFATHFHVKLSFAILNLFGVVEGIMWICTIIEVRKRFLGLFCCCCARKSHEIPTVQYSAKDSNMIEPDT